MPESASQIVKKLEYVLNTDIVIKDPKKVEVLSLADRSKQEY